MRNLMRRPRRQESGTYGALTWRVLVAAKRDIITAHDAKIALEAIRLRESPRGIERFIDVSIRIKELEDRRATNEEPAPATTP